MSTSTQQRTQDYDDLLVDVHIAYISSEFFRDNVHRYPRDFVYAVAMDVVDDTELDADSTAWEAQNSARSRRILGFTQGKGKYYE